MNISRRGLLGMFAANAAAVIVPAGILMPINPRLVRGGDRLTVSGETFELVVGGYRPMLSIHNILEAIEAYWRREGAMPFCAFSSRFAELKREVAAIVEDSVVYGPHNGIWLRGVEILPASRA